jgi:hypothetical protein
LLAGTSFCRLFNEAWRQPRLASTDSQTLSRPRIPTAIERLFAFVCIVYPMVARSRFEPIPPEVLLADYPPPHREIARELQRIVTDAVPEAAERVRTGWRLIGYDLPGRRNGSMFAWVWLEPEHVHLGFPHGVEMDDPRRVLRGAGITKLARWLTYGPEDRVDADVATDLVLEAARIRRMSRGERRARRAQREADG